ncbi:MAG: class I SAM-dependent methyltransferase, partial [Nanoarchaeota archaeon]
PEKGTILDVGCGAGVFLYTFKKYFPQLEAWGVEPTPGFADFAKEEGIHIDEGYLTESTYRRTFDLISLIHVLEHIEDPKPMLLMLKKYLEPESMIYIESPSVKDIGYLPPSHDRFMCQHEVIFSREVLEQILKEQGYRPVVSEDFISIRKRNNIRILAKLL